MPVRVPSAAEELHQQQQEPMTLLWVSRMITTQVIAGTKPSGDGRGINNELVKEVGINNGIWQHMTQSGCRTLYSCLVVEWSSDGNGQVLRSGEAFV